MRFFDKDSHHDAGENDELTKRINLCNNFLYARPTAVSIFATVVRTLVSASRQKRNIASFEKVFAVKLWNYLNIFIKSRRTIFGRICVRLSAGSAAILWSEIVRHLWRELVTLALHSEKMNFTFYFILFFSLSCVLFS